MVVPSRAEAPTDGTELRFQRLLENAQDLIYRFRVAPPRGYDYINSACLAITGHAAAEFYADAQLILKIVHPDDLPLVSEAFQDDPERMQRAILVRWVHPDGRIVWVAGVTIAHDCRVTAPEAGVVILELKRRSPTA